jgi:hypothetical protein
MQKRDMKMKKIFALIIVLSIAGFSCGKKCNIDKPKHLKPIDWENYNDVYTVKWNYTGDCSVHYDKEKIIKIYGWIFQPVTVAPNDFYLLSDSLLIETHNPKCAMVRVQCFNKESLELIRAKFDTSDLKKKCYVTGKLVLFNLSNNDCCHTSPEIFVEKSDEILFE